MKSNSMSSTRPYLIRAIHEWLEDNLNTPYLMVDAELPGVEVPHQYVKDGRIVLNMSSSAVRGLTIGDEAINFSARFNTVPHDIYVPIAAALAVFSKETGVGINFEEAGDIVPPLPPTPPESPTPPPGTTSKSSKKDSGQKGKPSLRVIK